MRRRLLFLGVIAGFVIGWLIADPPAPESASASKNGPPEQTTGAPLPPPGGGGGYEVTCADCHGIGADNITPGGLLSIIAPSTYVPNTVYPIWVKLEDPTRIMGNPSRWGFEIVAIKDSDLSMAGSFTAGSTTTTMTGAGRMYVGQITAGLFPNQPDSASWTFDWTAPAQGSGTVTFYAAGNAADGDGGTSAGDHTYTTSLSVAEDIPSAVLPTTWGMIKNRYR